MLMIADHYDRIAHDTEKTDAKTMRSAKMVSAFAPLICISRLIAHLKQAREHLERIAEGGGSLT